MTPRNHLVKQPNLSSIATVDIGNTQTSIAIFEGDELKEFERFSSKNLESKSALPDFCQKCQSLVGSAPLIAMSSVVPNVASALKTMFHQQFSEKPIFEITYQTKLPFHIRYQTPETLGNDRLALCAAACERFPNQAVMIIDFGTAITYDVLNSKHEYLGGLILAGTSLSARALNEHTAQLPAIGLQKESGIIGRNTRDCLSKGLFWGTVAQTEGLILKLKSELAEEHGEPEVKVLITGGNSVTLAGAMPHIDIRDEFAIHKGIRFIAALNTNR
ncbi:putative transcriptional acitvator, Baf family [Chloroherpeton thalassium ATCC 35110]|uniref:Type III pantothenate kinase n=1 Tax=Chloroherpeton thalassium (strain ATCC 35110 / GB-78) TaxID=517418 RepID=B3QVP4_CHLT3|nr:pantothenate kinase [Chloroherpeton thalassium]ACF13101.1 putative transcriptional acitvator, Baf family [Chloroherpeton thalassium ATCC 35110]